MKTHYSILGVNQSSTMEEIKTAYKILARKYHPDLNKSPDAEDKFKEINSSYEILSDKSKRDFYDLSLKPSNFHYSRPESWNILKNKDISITYFADIEDIFDGRRVNINFKPNRSNSQTNDIEIISISIPRNCPDNHIVVVPGKGDNENTSIRPGDLLVRIKIKNGKFTRNRGNLSSTVKVNIFHLMSGCEKIIQMIDGGEIKLKIKPNTLPGSVLRIPGKGLYQVNNTRGDLELKLECYYPDMTDDQKHLIEILGEKLLDTTISQYKVKI